MGSIPCNLIHKAEVIFLPFFSFPEPMVPEIWRAGAVLGDAFVIALIAFSICFSLASFYARKEGYEVDPNQVSLTLCLFSDAVEEGSTAP